MTTSEVLQGMGWQSKGGLIWLHPDFPEYGSLLVQNPDGPGIDAMHMLIRHGQEMKAAEIKKALGF